MNDIKELKYKGKKIRKNVLQSFGTLYDYSMIDLIGSQKFLIIKYFSSFLSRYVYSFYCYDEKKFLNIETAIFSAYKYGLRINFDEFQKIKKMG